MNPDDYRLQAAHAFTDQYTTSPTSPSAALGVAQLGTALLVDDLTADPDDD